MGTIGSESHTRDDANPLRAERYFDRAPAEILGAVLDQSVDCIKVIGPTGQLDFMNRNGRCAMEIDDFALVAGRNWWDLWPEESRHLIMEAIERAKAGETHRFEAYCPTAKGSPRWWEVAVSPLRDEHGTMQGIVSISRDITDRVTAQELRQAASEEMRHRLHNAYALTGAIIFAAAKGSPEREAFAHEINARLERLGIAQSLLLDPQRFGTASLPTLFRRLIEPFCNAGCELRLADLPEIELGEERTRALALTLGELSTNSNKYGALGHGGSIDLSASIDTERLCIRWCERLLAAPPIALNPGGKGFKLIERALRAGHGNFEVAWQGDGLDVVITLPAD